MKVQRNGMGKIILEIEHTHTPVSRISKEKHLGVLNGTFAVITS